MNERIGNVDVRAHTSKVFSYPPEHPQFHVTANTQDRTIKLSGNIILAVDDPESADIVATFLNIVARAEDWLKEQPV